MKHFLFLLLLLSLSSFHQVAEDCKPLTEGIYVYKLNDEHSAVLRFYPDGVIIASTSTNNYKEVMTWFNRDKENFSRVLSGKYSEKKCTIKFDVKGETGSQSYKGTVNGNTLQLHITNPDHSSTDRIYTFMKI